METTGPRSPKCAISRSQKMFADLAHSRHVSADLGLQTPSQEHSLLCAWLSFLFWFYLGSLHLVLVLCHLSFDYIVTATGLISCKVKRKWTWLEARGPPLLPLELWVLTWARGSLSACPQSRELLADWS